LGYFNGDLPFWLGWAQEVEATMSLPRKLETGAQAKLDFPQGTAEKLSPHWDLALTIWVSVTSAAF